MSVSGKGSPFLCVCIIKKSGFARVMIMMEKKIAGIRNQRLFPALAGSLSSKWSTVRKTKATINTTIINESTY